MDAVIAEAMKYGLTGVVVAALIVVGRVLGPSLTSVLPGIFAGRAKREDRVIVALEKHIEISTAVVEGLRALVAQLADMREDLGDVKIDVQYIADKVDVRPLPSRSKRGKVAKPEVSDAVAK